MALSQSIDDAREERVGRHGVTAPAFADALARTGEALAFIRARHADGKLPLLRLPGKDRRSRQHRSGGETARRRRPSEPVQDIVFLGTGGSSLGGQTVAQLAGCGVPGVGALRPGPAPAFHG